MAITAKMFATGAGHRVLTDEGQQGWRGELGGGSTTERQQGRVAEAIYANCSMIGSSMRSSRG